MDIKIRLGYSHPDDSGPVAVAWIIALMSILVSRFLLASFGPCPGIDISRNSSNITLPPPPPYCPRFMHICLCESISVNGNVTVESCIGEKSRRLSYLFTINVFFGLILMIRKMFTVEGQDRRRFLFAIYLLCMCILSVVMMLIFWHDCYHRMFADVGLCIFGVVSCAMIRASEVDRNREQAHHERHTAPNRY